MTDDAQGTTFTAGITGTAPPLTGGVLGWAVTDKDGQINVRTVQDSKVGAMVNWLLTDAHTMIADAEDATVEWWFAAYAPAGVECVEVIIRRLR